MGRGSTTQWFFFLLDATCFLTSVCLILFEWFSGSFLLLYPRLISQVFVPSPLSYGFECGEFFFFSIETNFTLNLLVATFQNFALCVLCHNFKCFCRHL